MPVPRDDAGPEPEELDPVSSSELAELSGLTELLDEAMATLNQLQPVAEVRAGQLANSEAADESGPLANLEFIGVLHTAGRTRTTGNEGVGNRPATPQVHQRDHTAPPAIAPPEPSHPASSIDDPRLAGSTASEAEAASPLTPPLPRHGTPTSVEVRIGTIQPSDAFQSPLPATRVEVTVDNTVAIWLVVIGAVLVAGLIAVFFLLAL